MPAAARLWPCALVAWLVQLQCVWAALDQNALQPMPLDPMSVVEQIVLPARTLQPTIGDISRVPLWPDRFAVSFDKDGGPGSWVYSLRTLQTRLDYFVDEGVQRNTLFLDFGASPPMLYRWRSRLAERSRSKDPQLARYVPQICVAYQLVAPYDRLFTPSSVLLLDNTIVNAEGFGFLEADRTEGDSVISLSGQSGFLRYVYSAFLTNGSLARISVGPRDTWVFRDVRDLNRLDVEHRSLHEEVLRLRPPEAACAVGGTITTQLADEVQRLLPFLLAAPAVPEEPPADAVSASAAAAENSASAAEPAAADGGGASQQQPAASSASSTTSKSAPVTTSTKTK